MIKKNNQASKADVKVMVQTVRYLITLFFSFTFTHYREIPTEGDKALCKVCNASMLLTAYCPLFFKE